MMKRSTPVIHPPAQILCRMCSTAAWYVLLTITLVLIGCQTVPERAPVEKEGKVYGTTKGLFRNRWWNYYERALSFADGGFWSDAELDLLAAIQQRKDDQRRARTYGMHFVDFFPHRELGIVYYHQGRIHDALNELSTSLASVKTAKAELYIDRVRNALIEIDKLDKRPPEVTIESPSQNYLTNAFSIKVRGIARDDTFVRHIAIGGEDLCIDVSSNKIPFQVDVPLVPGLNDIPIVITDLSGKKSRSALKIKVDRSGPVIRIDSPVEENSSISGGFILKGYAFDDEGLAELVVNGRKFACHRQRRYKIEQSLSFGPGEQKLLIEARDLAGNVTVATLDLKTDVKWKHVRGDATSEKDRMPPTILIRGIKEGQTTFLDQAFIEGNVKDSDIVTQIALNDDDILNKPGNNLYFSKIVKLKEGLNVFNVRVADGSGNVDTKQIRIKRIPLKIHQLGSRLRIAVNAFSRTVIGADEQKSYGFEDLLTAAIIDHGRFSAIERQQLTVLLEELKLSQSKLVDEKTALRLGRILAADCVLLGTILERKNSVEAYARIVDTETTEILAAVDVYGEDIDIGVLRTLSMGMELKLHRELPVVEGLIVEGGNKDFIIDMGKHSGIKSGMKLIVYDLVDPVAHPTSDQIVGQHFVEIGQARVQSVMAETSYARIIEAIDGMMVKPRQHAITR